MLVGLLLVAAGLAVAGNIGWFYLRQHVEGAALLHQEDKAISAARTLPTVPCPPFSNTSRSPQGVLDVKSIGMTAPVLGGDGATQLAVAVGHVPGSSWPGQPGTAILAAHDVTYFTDVDRLTTGSLIDFATPCRTYVYRVSGHQIVHTGTPIYSNPAQSELVLETCYPTNALFLTSQRFLVTASLVTARRTGVPTPRLETPVVPSVPAPPALAAQGLTLATNNTELGTLTLSGTPAPSWAQSMAPFNDEAAVLAEYFGAIRSAEQGQPGWWNALAKGVSITAAAPLAGATIDAYEVALGITLDATGTRLTGASLHGHLEVRTGPAPGEYTIEVAISDHHTQLTVSGWTMTAI